MIDIEQLIVRTVTDRDIISGLPLWTNGPTGEEYLKGFIRINEEGVSRGSYVEGLTTLRKTFDFLKSLNFAEVKVSEHIQYKDCKYYEAQLPVEYIAYTGIKLLKDCNIDNVYVKSGEHGDYLSIKSDNNLERTFVVSIIVEDDMLSTWYPGKFTATSGIGIPDDKDLWNPEWAVKIGG